MPSTRETQNSLHQEAATSFAVILVIMAILAALILDLRRPPPPPPAGPLPLAAVNAGDAVELENIYDEHDYHWPPDAPVPRLALQQMPPDMGKLAVARKKKLFFRSVLPLVLAENRRIRHQRDFVRQALDHYDSLTAGERRRLEAIAGEYKVEGDPARSSVRARLLRRVDFVPPALALAQAAIESAWGDSRFTVEANSLFGIWTWEESRGVVPENRRPGANHLVHAYPDLQASVRDYMHNLNTGHAYRLFRLKRREMRLNGGPLNAMALAGTLLRYSERGFNYVAEIRQIILGNDLTRLDPRLAG
jgi:Bax protein